MATSSQYGIFVPTNINWRVQQVLGDDKIDNNLKQLMVDLWQYIGNISMAVNARDAGVYYTWEQVCGQTFFPNPNNNSSTPAVAAQRQVLRTVINFGALPNDTTASAPHNITCTAATTFTRIYATASDPTDMLYIPIPNNGSYASEIYADDTNVYIISSEDLSSFTVCYVILEYIQT